MDVTNTHTHTHTYDNMLPIGPDNLTHTQVTLVRGNTRLFKKFVGVLTRGIGQRFVEGMYVPVLE